MVGYNQSQAYDPSRAYVAGDVPKDLSICDKTLQRIHRAAENLVELRCRIEKDLNKVTFSLPNDCSPEKSAGAIRENYPPVFDELRSIAEIIESEVAYINSILDRSAL